MKIRRITAPDMRQAIRLVREELGADAVILSNKRTDEGVEIVAALDIEVIASSAAKTPAQPAERRGSGVNTVKPSLAWPPNNLPPVDEELDFWAEDSASFSPRAAAMQSALPRQAEAPVKERAEPPRLKPLHEPAALLDDALPDPYAHDRQRASGASGMGGEVGVQASVRAASEASLSVSRLEDEVRGLRSLMESQLRVLEWRRYARHHPLQSELMRRLTGLGLAPCLVRELVEDLGDATLDGRGWDLALRALGARIPVLGEDLTESGGMFALVGATGVGKTTTVAKLAARFVMRHGRKDIALVSTDNYRIGAYDQLRAYARILDIPLYVAEDADSLARTLDGLSDRRLVLVDTAGMSQRDTRLMEQMTNLRASSSRLQSLLVLSASAQRQMTREAVQRFSHLPLAGCVLSKLDEAAQLGDALSAVIDARLPVAWLGMGQRVPEDLAPARAERLVARAVEMMQQTTEDEMIEERMSWSGVASHG